MASSGSIEHAGSSRRVLFAALMLLAGSLAACGGDDSSTAASDRTDSRYLAQNRQEVRELEQPPAGAWPGPKDAPKPKPGMRITILSCSQASDGCAEAAREASEAAKVLGWQAQVCDGRGEPNAMDQCIRSALAGNADGIMGVAVPPDLVQAALRLAKREGVPYVNESDIESRDPLVAANAPLAWEAQGEAVAKWVIADSGGDAQALVIRDDSFPGVKLRSDAFIRTLRECSGCEVLDEPTITNQEAFSPRMIQLIQAASNRFGEQLQYILSPYGATQGLTVPAARVLNRGDDVKLVDFDGGTLQTENCRAGRVSALGVAIVGWHAWAGMDQMVRVLAGAKPVDANYVPTFLGTKNNCPASGQVAQLAEIDFRAEYRRLWGVQ